MQDSVLWEEAYLTETKQSQKQSGNLLLISFFSFLFDYNYKYKNEHIKQVNANIYLLNALISNYSHFVPILTLRRDNS